MERLVSTLAKDSPDAALVTELTGGWWDGAFLVIGFGPAYATAAEVPGIAALLPTVNDSHVHLPGSSYSVASIISP